ncbi:MAG TPA: hypothetical protein VLI92_00960 [Candidatus Saccharimonadales bacterium]|nr:hypothetical protein [Candidatus Saccharimonadales bacterium]
MTQNGSRVDYDGYSFETVKDPATIVDNVTVRQEALKAGFKVFMPASGEWLPLETFGTPKVKYTLDIPNNKIHLIINAEGNNLIFAAYPLR